MKSYQPLFNFMHERHSIYCRRAAGQPWPWSDDKIFQTWKFTNVYRELDRVSRWMRVHFTDPNDDPKNGALMVFNCGLFRFFGTETVAKELGFIKRWKPEIAAHRMQKLKDAGNTIFTGAYVITGVSNEYQGSKKARIVCCDYLQDLWDHRNELYRIARETRSLEQTHKYLMCLRGFGGSGFMAYEVVSDLRHTYVLRDATDIMTWANPGPGARHGLNLLCGRPRGFRIKRDDMIEEMRTLHGQISTVWPEEWPKLEMREIEHSLCEFDKYERFNQGIKEPKARYRPPSEQKGISV